MRASRGEIRIANILEKYEVNFQEEYIIPGLNAPSGKPLRFDFAIFDDDDNLEFLLEYQGRQHYEPVAKFGGVRGLCQQQYNDNLKKRYCAIHNIKLILIPYTDEGYITYDYIFKKAGY